MVRSGPECSKQKTMDVEPTPRKLSRAEKTAHNRAALIDAAAVIVGEEGYQGASISRITLRAGLGQGTFYRYFETQQDLFDLLLPEKGAEALAHIREAAHGAQSFIEAEGRSMRAFFLWVQDRPWFFRLLYEAHIAAPKGYRIHFDNIRSRYRKTLFNSWKNGEFPDFAEAELETIVVILIAARDYLFEEFQSRSDRSETALSAMIATYQRLISTGLHGRTGSR